jgi:hypothetical protein
MKKKDLLIGFLIGIVADILGTYVILISLTKYHTLNDLQLIRQEGIIGKVMTLGAILNLIVFFILLHYKKELMARGIVLATIVLALLTLFM